jgi:two-component system cell cycle response regulator DivK
VQDTGPGIPPEDQTRTFEEFQQVDKSITRRKGGTRLGFSISRRLSNLHGGNTELQWTLGVGSTIEAVDGEKGVAMTAEQKPDLILMDIQLPLVDGCEATRRIKANPDLKSIPGHRGDVLRPARRRGQGDGGGLRRYFAKPFSPRVILAKIREFLA